MATKGSTALMTSERGRHTPRKKQAVTRQRDKEEEREKVKKSLAAREFPGLPLLSSLQR